MKIKELIEKLNEYNPEAIFGICINGRPLKENQYEICYGSSEGVTKKNCEDVDILCYPNIERIS